MEVLIVVALLSIVALLVMPSGGGQDEDRLRSAARLLIADLEFAQLRSIADASDPCVIVLDLDTNTYHIAKQSEPATPIVDPGSNQPYVTTFGTGRAAQLAGVTLDAAAGLTGDQLGFTSLGVLDQGPDAAITLRSGAQTMQVIVDAPTGEPRVAQ
jgi:Tfp pilus assembly protein FimT